MTHSQSILLYLWCSQAVLHSFVAGVVWRRKLHKQFPVFFWFLIVQVANFAIMFPLWRGGNHNWLTENYLVYFVLFWTGEAINAVLGFKVIHEVFLDVFRPYHTLKDLGTLLFRWAGVVMLMVSVVVAFSNSIEQSPLVHAVTTLQRSVRVVQFGLILFLLLFSRYLGVSRKQMSFGVALGFGFFAGVELMLMAMNSGGLVTSARLNLINMGAYLVSIMVWMAYSMAHGAGRSGAGKQQLQTQRWEQGLADLQHPVASDSLIPMFENMVERALSRNSNAEQHDAIFPMRGNQSPQRANSAAAGSKNQS